MYIYIYMYIYFVFKYIYIYRHIFCEKPADSLGWRCRWANETSIRGVGGWRTEGNLGGRTQSLVGKSEKQVGRMGVNMYSFWGVVMQVM